MGFFSAHEIDPADIQRDFAGILLPGETVLTAFKTIRDTVFLTDHRFVMVNVQGITGSKRDVVSVPYKSIVAFSVESAGTFDLDSDLKLFVTGGVGQLIVKISKKADPQAILRTLAEQVMLKR
jgi:hypothetical protein